MRFGLGSGPRPGGSSYNDGSLPERTAEVPEAAEKTRKKLCGEQANHRCKMGGTHPAYGSIRLPSTSRNLRIHSGWAGQAGAVTRLPSTTALEKVAFTSAQRAPARTRSGLTAG